MSDSTLIHPHEYPAKPRAVTFDLSTSGSSLHLHVDIDSTSVGGLHVDFDPSVGKLDPSEAHLLGASLGVVVAQICMSEVVRFQFGLAQPGHAPLFRILRLLYDSHAYAQSAAHAPTAPLMELNIENLNSGIIENSSDSRRAVLLWSGGKDSLASLLALRRNGFTVVGLHITANFSCAQQEFRAAHALADLYGLPLIHVEFKWDIVQRLGRTYSSVYDSYPAHNAIPFGRDLALIAAAAVIARREGARYVCAGYETDLWERIVSWKGRLVARHDVQSRIGGVEVNRLLGDCVGVQFFSPLAGLREYKILRHLLKYHVGAWPHIESCFWGGWCGRCSKCARYQLVQRHLGLDLMYFRTSALEPDSAYIAYLATNLRNSSIAFWEEQVYCLLELHRSGRLTVVDPADALLRSSYGWYAGSRRSIASTLESIVPDKLAPLDFQWGL